MSREDKTCFIRWPNLPPLEQNVWEVKYSMFIPVRCLSSPAPKVVIWLKKFIVKMPSVADDSCTNATVGYITIKSGSVACVIVNNSRPF